MQKIRTAELTQKRENQSMIRLFVAFCLAALAVIAWSASAFAVAAPPDPVPSGATFGVMDAQCTSEGLLQWLDPVDGTITVYMLPQGTTNPRGVRTPVAEITMTDGHVVHGYCLNALQNGPSDRPYCLDAPVDDIHLAYLISKYPPTLASGVQQGARQAAVWHYTNGWNLNADSTTSLDPDVDAAVTAAYNAILADVDSLDVNNLPAELMPGDPVLEIAPLDATNWLPASPEHPFTVTLTKGGKPLAGYTVNVASDFGALDKTTATTDGNGQAAFTVTSNVAGTANLTATASFEIRASMRFFDKLTPTFNQPIGGGDPTQYDLTANARKTWIYSPGQITLTKDVVGTAEPWSFTFQLNGANDQTVTNAAPSATWDNLTPNQVYTLSEVDPGTQWQMGAISCLVDGDPASDGDANTPGFQVNVTPGSFVACSITNTVTPGKITLTKNVVGATEDWSFIFQLNGANDQTVTNAAPVATWDNLTPNQIYTLSEVYPGAGWQVGEIGCLVNGAPVTDQDPNTDGFQVNVTPGSTVACSITNTVKPGKITLTKNVEGTTEPWSFTFQLNGGNDQTVTNGSPVASWDNLTPNQVYTLSEVNPGTGWQMGAISCLVNDAPVADANPNEEGFQVNVTPGSTVTCSITNTRLPGKITLTKNVFGTTEPWAFGFTLNGGDLRTATNNAAVVSWENLVPNATYTLEEVNPGAAWSVGGFICSVGGEDLQDADAGLAGYQIVVPAGSNVVCSIDNTKVPPSLSKITLTKNVFGTTEPWSFGFTLNGDVRTATNNQPVVSWENLTPNVTYTLVEVDPGANWIVGGFICSVGEEDLVDADPNLDGYQIVAPAGSNVVCSIDNTKTQPEPGKITVTKHVVGAVEAWSFTFQLNGTNDQIVTNEAPVATWENLTPNQIYTVSEVDPGAQWQVGAISCLVNNQPVSDSDPNAAGFQVDVTPGAVVACDLTNTLKPGIITLTKSVVGTTEPWSFTFQLNGDNDRTVTNASPVATWDNLASNHVYTLSEVDPGVGWQKGAISCLVNNEPVEDGNPNIAGFQVNVTPGSTVACSITNTLKPGKITLTKHVVGTAEAWSFTFQLDNANDRTVTNGAPTATWDNLAPDQIYTVSEVDPGARWQAGEISCLVNGKPIDDRDPNAVGFQVNVTAGSIVACTITNTYIPVPARIAVTKIVSGTDVTTWSFQFTLDGSRAMTATHDAPTVAWEGLAPNRTYTLAEVNPGKSWTMGAFTCVVGGQTLPDANPNKAGFQANVKPGDDVACRITNAKVGGSGLDPGKEPGAFNALIYMPAVNR